MHSESNPAHSSRPTALLLIGPTGAGKTPLGEYIGKVGLWGRKCRHFDFGHRMRAVASDEIVVPSLAEEDLAIIKDALATGVLLEDHQFHIAATILRGFIESECTDQGVFIVLNGLPRHLGQARDVDKIVSIEGVISLVCSPRVVHDRIEYNSGGDRSERTDDSLPEIARKLEIFKERTVPLLDHCRHKGIRIHEVSVENDSGPEDIVGQLEKETD